MHKLMTLYVNSKTLGQNPKGRGEFCFFCYPISVEVEPCRVFGDILQQSKGLLDHVQLNNPCIP